MRMSFNYLKYLTAIAAGLTLFSCNGKEEPKPDEPTTPEVKANIKLSDTDDIPLPAGESSATVEFTSALEWTASSDADWLAVSPDKGKSGTHKITVTAGANGTDKDRTASVTIESGDKKASVKVVVK